MKTVNPFERHGIDPSIMDATVQILKRGHNGDGQPLIIDEARGGRIVVDDGIREVVADMVDSARGEDSARTVGYGIVGLLYNKLF